MPGQIVHIEIPADDTEKARELWGSSSARSSRQTRAPVRVPHDPDHRVQPAPPSAQPGKPGARARTSTSTTSNEGVARGQAARRRGARRCRCEHGLVRDLQGPARQRVRPLADRPVRAGTDRLAEDVNRRRRMRAPPVVHPAYASDAARSSSAMSSLRICIIAAITRSAFSSGGVGPAAPQDVVGHDLPREAEAVLHPAARALLPALAELSE